MPVAVLLEGPLLPTTIIPQYARRISVGKSDVTVKGCRTFVAPKNTV
jgi:hypothetical protein